MGLGSGGSTRPARDAWCLEAVGKGSGRGEGRKKNRDEDRKEKREEDGKEERTAAGSSQVTRHFMVRQGRSSFKAVGSLLQPSSRLAIYPSLPNRSRSESSAPATLFPPNTDPAPSLPKRTTRKPPADSCNGLPRRLLV